MGDRWGLIMSLSIYYFIVLALQIPANMQPGWYWAISYNSNMKQAQAIQPMAAQLSNETCTVIG